MKSMQIYRILTAVCVLALSSRAARNGGCSIPQILNGDLKEVTGSSRMNWNTFSFDRRLANENEQVGSVRPHRAELFLTCHDGYYVKGTDMSRALIMCLGGSWSPDAVCLPNDTEYSPTPTQASFLTDSPESDDICSCEYMLENNNIIAYADGKLVKFHDRVKNGSLLKMRCEKVGYHRFLGPHEILCEKCQYWNSSDFPTCTRPEIGDAMIFPDNIMNISLEGFLEVQKGKPLRLTCSVMETAEFPIWNVPNVAELNLTEEVKKRKNDIELYLSHLHIERISAEEEGAYICELQKGGRPAVMQVKVVET